MISFITKKVRVCRTPGSAISFSPSSRLNPAMAPTADPDLRAGKFISLGLGVNFIVPTGTLQGLRLSIEGTMPVYQKLDGPQIERDYAVFVALSKAF